MKRRFLLILALFLVAATAWVIYQGYSIIRKPNVIKEFTLFIPTGAGLPQVLDSLEVNNVLGQSDGIQWVADQKNYVNNIHPGRYLLEKGWSNEQLIDKLRSGEQDPVRVTFNNVKRIPQLAEQIARYVEPSASDILSVLKNDSIMAALGHSKESLPGAFVPDTYEVWWNTSASDLVMKLVKEGDRFWNDTRRKKAAAWGLTRNEVSSIASIVQEETTVMDDAPIIAGVYLNRVRIGMPLQADPTIKFALNADSVRRILDVDKEVDSPYNTYRYSGIPPGPINIPEPRYIDAVLNAQKHRYIYFCASDDMSGKSVFARTYGEHLRNARRYQSALNKMKIYR